MQMESMTEWTIWYQTGEDVAVIMMFSTATSDKHVNEIVDWA